MAKRKNLMLGETQGAKVALDLKVSEHQFDDGSSTSGKRIIAFKDPDLVMTILTDPDVVDYVGTPIEVRTPKEFDREFRKSVEENLDYPDMLKGQGEVYRRVMGCYGGYQGLSENELNSEIDRLTRRREKEFEKEIIGQRRRKRI